MDEYREDLPELIRGRLDSARAAEILRAAESDAELREAIEQERTLERWLEYYEVPELDAGFERRFWNRFHEDKVAGSRGAWMFKLIGPLAAGVLIAIGIIIFMNNDETSVQPEEPTTAEANKPGGPEGNEDGGEVELDLEAFNEGEYVVGVDTALDRSKLDLDTLELLKALDDPAFLALDNLERPEDMAVIDELELLSKLAEDE